MINKNIQKRSKYKHFYQMHAAAAAAMAAAAAAATATAATAAASEIRIVCYGLNGAMINKKAVSKLHRECSKIKNILADRRTSTRSQNIHLGWF